MKKIKKVICWVKENPWKTALIVTGVGVVVVGGVYVISRRQSEITVREFAQNERLPLAIDQSARKNPKLSETNDLKRDIQKATGQKFCDVKITPPTKDRAQTIDINFPKGDYYDIMDDLEKVCRDRNLSFNEESPNHVQVFQNR